VSIRLDNSSDNCLFDTSAPSGDFSALIWGRLLVDTNFYGSICALAPDSPGSPFTGLQFGVGNTGTDLVLYALSDTEHPVTTLSLNTWYHFALVGNTSTSQAWTVYLNGAVSASGTNGTATYSGQRVQLGMYTSAELWNGRLANFQLYNRQLTQPEIQAQMRYYTPLNPTSLWQWAPLINSGDVKDYSGNGRDFTPTSLTTEDGPPIVWAPRKRYFFVSSGGPILQAIGLVSENESIFSLDRDKTLSLGLPLEDDLTFSLNRAKQKFVGLVISNSLVQPIHNDIRRLINQSVTSETLFLLSSAKQKSIGMLTTTESPFVLGSVKTKELGSVVDSETLFAVTSSLPKLIAVNLVTENDTPFLLGHLKTKLLGLVNESLSPFAISPTKLRSLGMVSENEQLFALTSPGVIELGAVVEHDLTFLLLNEKSQTLQLLTETTTLSGLAVMKAKEIGFLAENETLTAVTYPLVRLVPQVTERDQLFTVMVVGPASTITYANASHIRRRRRAS